MSALDSSFSARMRKRAASAQGETTFGSKVPDGKRPKLFVPNEEAQKSQAVINMDSLD